MPWAEKTRLVGRCRHNHGLNIVAQFNVFSLRVGTRAHFAANPPWTAVLDCDASGRSCKCPLVCQLHSPL